MSSRICIKNLPPSITEEEFKKHFAKLHLTTDAKLFPQRRIGFVGYKTAEDAAKAVRYFNKSFIRMSRIAVELARPVLAEKPLARQDVASTARVDGSLVQISENKLKRKRGWEGEDLTQDPRLREYLEVMQPRKAKAWENEMVGDGLSKAEDMQEETAAVPEAESDDEYQAVPKTAKQSRDDAAGIGQDLAPTPAGYTPNGQQQLDANQNTPGPSVEDLQEPASIRQGPMSDADWLRSRTSRLLGLVEEADVSLTRRQASRDGTAQETQQLHQQEHITEGAKHPVADNETEKVLAASDKQEDDTTVVAIRNSGRLFLRNLSYAVTQAEIQDIIPAPEHVTEVSTVPPLSPAFPST